MFSGNMPGFDVLASDVKHCRTITIQVKSKTAGDWQTSIEKGRRWWHNPHDDRFWIFVDLAKTIPEYYVVPAHWIENNIWHTHQDYLDAHGGERVYNADSKHHRVELRRIRKWRDRWDLLGILPD